ncbi:hypothetical protein CHS0354_038839 [Potamilus streckersoni]|uniref:Uncharacterized protein n=1 Tax=Potamilus streckersoni TaxID=2493646 RepID=A0AAE0WEA1_9BIVA|nr:hypothetical protein CHS0354_038839 [Potamilus streckersoni]
MLAKPLSLPKLLLKGKQYLVTLPKLYLEETKKQSQILSPFQIFTSRIQKSNHKSCLPSKSLPQGYKKAITNPRQISNHKSCLPSKSLPRGYKKAITNPVSLPNLYLEETNKQSEIANPKLCPEETKKPNYKSRLPSKSLPRGDKKAITDRKSKAMPRGDKKAITDPVSLPKLLNHITINQNLL